MFFNIDVFFYLILQVEGPSRGSYGLNVARLAGIPDRVLALAARNAAWMRDRRAVETSSADKSVSPSVQCTAEGNIRAVVNNDATSSNKRRAEEPLESDTRKQPSF